MDNFCVNCKYYQIYKNCDDKNRKNMENVFSDGVCKKYLPIEPYYHAEQGNRSYGYSYHWINMDIDVLSDEINKNPEVKKEIIETVFGNYISNSIYKYLYEISVNFIKTIKYGGWTMPGGVHNSFISKFGHEDFEKCVSDNANAIVGQLFMLIKQSEYRGNMFVEDFLKLLVNKGQCANISYRDNNFDVKMDFSFGDRGSSHIFIDKKEKHIEIRSSHWQQSAEGYKREYVIKFFEKEIKDVYKGKADWKTGNRRYTVTFKNKKKLFVDIKD